MQSCRKVLDAMNLSDSENASLIMSRYVKNLDGNDKADSRKSLFDAMRAAAKNSRELYAEAFRIRRETLRMSAVSRCFGTVQQMAAGLGCASVLETGLSLNPLYGLPILAGSAIKGVTAHYCSETLSLDGEIFGALFGRADDNGEDEAGMLRFYDAWIIPEYAGKCFVNDVMTPHNADDFADPVPVSFLTVEGEFEVWVGCEDIKADREWAEFALSLVEAALRDYGIGGKIRAGYGKMKRVFSPEEITKHQREQKRNEVTQAGFTHFEGDVVEVVCTKIKLVKGKEKREFVFKDSAGDKNAVRFEQVPKVSEGDSFMAEVKRIDRTNKAYILQAK